MPARLTLGLLRPLLARHAQPSRLSSSCTDRSAPPPCPPCEATPPPPCRRHEKHGLPGRRVVCCPPPQGSPPPCAPPEPACALTCENRITKEPPTPPQFKPQLCGAARDVVAERLHCFKEHRRREYERAAAERRARPPAPPPAVSCALPGPGTVAVATDGRTYTVTADAPPPRCPPPPPSSEPCAAPRSAHPPPQPVSLAPQGDCRPQERPRLDPCEHAPRTLLSIDRTPRDPAPAASKSVPESPKSKPTEPAAAGYKGITSRIMDSLRSGRGSASPAPGWCANPPQPAPAPPRCHPPSLTDRLRRRSPRPPRGTRRLHTGAVCSAAAPNKIVGRVATGREATLAASEKLAAALKDRELLKEAGRGRCVRSASCEVRPPPPPRTNGGEIELGVPAGVDTVRVRVSMGKAKAPKPTASPSDTKTCPPPSCGASRPAQPACSDSWLSIKKLQKKISSSCGRSEPAASAAPAAPAAKPCAGAGQKPGPAYRPPPRAPPSGGCCPQGRVKMTDVLTHTIFVKS